MKVSLFVGAGLFLQCVNGIAVFPRQQQVPGVVSAPVWRRDQTHNVEADLLRRAYLQKRQSNTVSLNLNGAENKLLYFANRTPQHMLSKGLTI